MLDVGVLPVSEVLECVLEAGESAFMLSKLLAALMDAPGGGIIEAAEAECSVGDADLYFLGSPSPSLRMHRSSGRSCGGGIGFSPADAEFFFCFLPGLGLTRVGCAVVTDESLRGGEGSEGGGEAFNMAGIICCCCCCCC